MAEFLQRRHQVRHRPTPAIPAARGLQQLFAAIDSAKLRSQPRLPAQQSPASSSPGIVRLSPALDLEVGRRQPGRPVTSREVRDLILDMCRRSRRLRVNDAKAKMFLKRIKIVISVKQRVLPI